MRMVIQITHVCMLVLKGFRSFAYECAWWKLFHDRVMCTTFTI